MLDSDLNAIKHNYYSLNVHICIHNIKKVMTLVNREESTYLTPIYTNLIQYSKAVINDGIDLHLYKKIKSDTYQSLQHYISIYKPTNKKVIKSIKRMLLATM